MTVKKTVPFNILEMGILESVFDLPAKMAVLCAKQYNGEFGC